MKQRVLALLMMVGDLAGFTGYCFAWLDWIRDLTEGIYARNRQEAALETSALMAYSYGAIQFMNRRLNPRSCSLLDQRHLFLPVEFRLT